MKYDMCMPVPKNCTMAEAAAIPEAFATGYLNLFIEGKIKEGDTLLMKKEHPCGQKQWKVLRTGADFRLKCLGCGHEIMVPRVKAEKAIKKIITGE